MNQQLPIAIKEASAVAHESAALLDRLKSILNHSPEAVSGGVDPFVFAITIFILSCFVGYYVVWKVTPSLHTPLMSITNAISGIIILGSMLAGGVEYFSISNIFGYIATFLAAINIFGGFIVTKRMLQMFKKK
jgi:NAD(P) transhydrogenase subunit alpha